MLRSLLCYPHHLWLMCQLYAYLTTALAGRESNTFSVYASRWGHCTRSHCCAVLILCGCALVLSSRTAEIESNTFSVEGYRWSHCATLITNECALALGTYR